MHWRLDPTYVQYKGFPIKTICVRVHVSVCMCVLTQDIGIPHL